MTIVDHSTEGSCTDTNSSIKNRSEEVKEEKHEKRKEVQGKWKITIKNKLKKNKLKK